MADKSQKADSGKEIREKKKQERKDKTTTERSSDFVGRPLLLYYLLYLRIL